MLRSNFCQVFEKTNSQIKQQKIAFSIYFRPFSPGGGGWGRGTLTLVVRPLKQNFFICVFPKQNTFFLKSCQLNENSLHIHKVLIKRTAYVIA